VIDPTSKRVTHLVVEPHDQHGLARLVPVELAEALPERGGIALRCTVEELRQLAPVQESAYLRLGEFPVSDPDWDVGVQEVLALPYYGEPYAGAPGGLAAMPVDYESKVPVSYDRIPKGEVEIRRSSAVTAAHGEHLGHVDGFVVGSDDQITHLVLERGHLWGRREVTIPIGAVASVRTDAVTLTLSKDEVGLLPSVPVRRWSGDTR
jgi:hypothetical protein